MGEILAKLRSAGPCKDRQSYRCIATISRRSPHRKLELQERKKGRDSLSITEKGSYVQGKVGTELRGRQGKKMTRSLGRRERTKGLYHYRAAVAARSGSREDPSERRWRS